MASLFDTTDTRWFRFLSRWSLAAGLMLLSLLLLAIMVVLPASQHSVLPAEYRDLVAAASSPALYRLFAAFDMAVWLGLGGLFVTLAAIFARVAPIRSAFIRAGGIGLLLVAVSFLALAVVFWRHSPVVAPLERGALVN